MNNIRLSQNVRETWIDLARGAAIFLVCAFHAATVLRFAYTPPAALLSVHDLFAAFRMPLLAFLSGLIAERSLSKPADAYYLGKARSLLYPYLVWTIVFCLTAGADRDWLSTTTLFSYLWYLGFIFCFYIIIRLLQPVPRSWLIVCSLVASAWMPSNWEAPNRFAFLFAIFVSGVLISESGRLGWWKSFVRSRWTTIFGVPVILFFVAVRLFGNEWDPEYKAWKYDVAWISATFAGIAVASAAAIWVQNSKFIALNRVLEFMGKNSIVYYLTHYPVIYGTVLACSEIGVSNAWLACGISLTTALLVGTFSVYAGQRVGPVRWLYQFPYFARAQ